MDPDSRAVRSKERGARNTRNSRVAVSVIGSRSRSLGGDGLAAWLAAVAPRSAAGDVAIALVSDGQMRRLNRIYRRTDSVTDVLSFPARAASRPPHSALRTPHSALRPTHLGDIAIATGVARRQAREARHPYATELRVLALHGLLHLLGYDHDDPADQGRMARVERALRRKGGLDTALIERAQRATRERASDQ